ncbi:hypothetical protein [Caballeronia sp. J97]|uniref:hypothetical protein n=1 Tax=Caballeronia sp. J97 TaxID=2805429 RepID=UPI002AB0F004|nr:hypothetical protein [Caballeronia sp. J97]
MESKMNVSFNEKGHAVVTYSMPLSDYCTQRARILRAMVQVVSGAKSMEESAAVVTPLMELIRTHVDELEPLFKSLDQRAYEKGFEDGRDVAFPKTKNHIEFAKGSVVDSTVVKPVR